MSIYDLNSQKTVFEKMTNKRLPDEPYPTMYKDGYTPNEILETTRNSIIREHYRRQEQESVQKDSEPMSVKLQVEVKNK